ncbi:chemotaxis protein CheW [Caldibacillus lycopersici]|uniref:Chemotaxis protein CheW n=1 Tax=Perspicuibacillus lycopersici TaxID=1325689 RepID=A0AAE3IP92_9BACI|nr:chemotaxis protein CheW [Perspicuibacillus lycopersici]MCU9612083.1 chemotaxis protein CheW [Perspicuibacillus lycopersici]
MTVQALDQERKIITFVLDQKLYALDVKYVKSIERMLPMTRVPHVPAYIKGVINLRGVIIPIADLRTQLHLDEISYSETTRVIIISTNDKEVGFIVDEAMDIIDIAPQDIESNTSTYNTEQHNFFEGVIKKNDQLMVLLDIEKLLTY